MLPPLFNIDLLHTALDEQALIITANQRLCSKAVDAWGQYQTTLDKPTWQAPAIHSLAQWLDKLWFNLQTQGDTQCFLPLASPDQQRILWERVTRNCGKMQTEQLAKQASSAWNHLKQWDLSLDDIRNNQSFINETDQTFITWCTQYQSLLKKHQLLSQEDKIKRLINAFSEQKLAQENNAYLIGFDDLSPLLSRLFNVAVKNETKKIVNQHAAKSLVRKRYDKPSDEIDAAMQWAKTRLQEDIHSRIGIIVPELGQCRDAIMDALTRTFEPQQQSIDTEQTILPFNISAGVPLGNTPLVADSLRLLRLLDSTCTLDDCLQWLYSPFWGHLSQDKPQRLALAEKLEKLEQFDISASQLRYFAQKVSQASPAVESPTQDDPPLNKPSLFSYLRQVHELKQSYHFHAKPSIWVEQFLAVLGVLDWPGERASDSMEHQQTQLWYQVLETFAGLDSVLGSINANEAVKQLGILARSTPFQAKVPDSPIQVLGILEGAGLRFTHCWVMGLNQQSWPPAPAPNPLLPFSLQKQHNMPHASAIRELAYAQSLTKQYRHCAETIVMSYATGNENGDIHWQPSRLIMDIPLSKEKEALADIPLQPSALTALDIIHCETAPKIKTSAETPKPLVGGTAVLKAMVENPFDAFARFRLGAKRIDTPVAGFSAKEQGIIMHQALAKIWETLKTQATLLAYNSEDLNSLVQSSVAQGVEEQQSKKRSHLKNTLCELETQRQTALILDWLELEKRRPEFSVIHVEETLTINVKSMLLEMRIDRIDQLADGSFLIIDYKTGSTSINAWKAENPEDPQLPLYLLAFKQTVSGIAFAQINIKARTIKGLHNGEQSIDNNKSFVAIGDNKINLPTTWTETKEHWQATIEALVARYIDGDTSITLKNTNGFNKDLLSLNRFNEAESINQYCNQY